MTQQIVNDPNDDIEPHNPQDALDTERPDPIMNELGEDPAEEIGINPSELRDGLNDIDTEANNSNDDWREEIEDRDQDGDNHDES
jgi:hypothetical protein